jgi:hypothetical protein
MNVNWKDWKVWLGLGIFVAVLVGLAIYDLLRRRREKKARESFKASGQIKAEADAARLPQGTIRIVHRPWFQAGATTTDHKAGRYSTGIDLVNRLPRLDVPITAGSLLVAPNTGVTFVSRTDGKPLRESVKPSPNGVAVPSINNMRGRISRVCIYTQGNEPATC